MKKKPPDLFWNYWSNTDKIWGGLIYLELFDTEWPYDVTRTYFGLQTVPWSKAKERKEKKKCRREGRQLRKKRKLAQLDDDELEDLAKDARLVKKLKKGKVSVPSGPNYGVFPWIKCTVY